MYSELQTNNIKTTNQERICYSSNISIISTTVMMMIIINIRFSGSNRSVVLPKLHTILPKPQNKFNSSLFGKPSHNPYPFLT